MATQAKAQVVIEVVAESDSAEQVMRALADQAGVLGSKLKPAEVGASTLLDRLREMGPGGMLAAKGMENVEDRLWSMGPAGRAAAEGMGQLDTVLGGVSKGTIIAATGTVAVAAGIAAAVAVVAKGTQEFVAYASQVRQVGATSGTTGVEASKLTGVMRMLRIDTERGARAFGLMGTAIQQGKFQQYGVEVARTADGNTDLVATLANVSDAYINTADKAQANAMASRILGEGYMELLPLLTRGGAALRELSDEASKSNPLLDEQDLKNAKELEASLQTLSNRLNKLWVDIGSKAAPAVNGLAQGLEVAAEKAGDLATKVQEGTADWGFAKWLIPVYGIALGINDIGSASDDAAPSVANLGTEIERTTEQAQSLSDAVVDYADAQISAQRAALNLEEATKGWEEEQAAKAEARAERIRQARESEADAERDLARAKADAARAVEDAERRVADTAERAAEQVAAARNRTAEAERRLAEARERDNRDARSIFDAQRDLARVQEDIAAGRLSGMDAVRAQQDAETDLNRSQEDAATAEQERQQRIADAEREVKEARAAERRAEIEGTQQVKRAREELARARVAADRTVEQAQRRLAEASNKVTEAQERQSLSARELRRHQLDVQAATIAVGKAQQTLRDRTREVVEQFALAGDDANDVDLILKRMGLTTIPNLRNQLSRLADDWHTARDAMADYYSAPGSSYAPGGSTYNSQVPAAGRAPQGVSAAGGSANISVNVSGAIITDPKSAEALGRTVAKGVAAEFQAMKAQGRRVI